MKKYLLIFFMLTLIIIQGCNNKNQDAILKNDGVSVNLNCLKSNECTDQQFNDLKSFQVFKSALDSAVKMPGLINYGAEYNLKITFQDQTTSSFHLSLGKNREMNGLLVDHNNTNQGFEIPVTYANKLRDLILDSDLSSTDNSQVTPDPVRIHKEAMKLQDRFLVPDGYRRVQEEDSSFPAYLRRLPLKEHGATVRYYNGDLKHNTSVYEAVINMDIGTKDLQQCADAIIRLRGEYLYKLGALKDIRFHLTNGFLVEYEKWMEGYRVAVDGNQTSWAKKYEPSDTYSDFMNYMEFVFIYAGTLSLEKELGSIPYESMQIGDVLIQGGSPGHAVIVIDMAEHMETGQKLYMLAQSYMPAQDIQVLANPNDDNLSPWYKMETELTEIRTPEWTFNTENLKRFP